MGFAPLNSGQIEGDHVTTGAMPWLVGAGLFLRQPTSPRIAVDLGAGAVRAWLNYSRRNARRPGAPVGAVRDRPLPGTRGSAPTWR